jgi:NarL family two-component system response regulator LiaR
LNITRVLVVDDHDLFRVGLASVLNQEPDIEVVAQASRGRMGIRLASELRPDVILLDLKLPDLDGGTVARAILRDHGQARVVMLTVIADELEISQAVAAGACGYLLKDSPIAEVLAAVRAAASGNAWLSPGAAKALLDWMRRAQPSEISGDVEIDLSPREVEVLRHLARGNDNNEIAAKLAISPRTVKNHVSSILTKLGVTSRLQAAIYALRSGIA